MRMLHLGLALAMLFGWTVSVEAAKGKKGSRPVNGVVTAVSNADKNSGNSGTITVQVQPNKKKNQAAAPAAVEKTFNVTSATTFQLVQRVKGQKGQTETTAAALKDVTKGTHLLIQANGDTAQAVKIVAGKKKKNK